MCVLWTPRCSADSISCSLITKEFVLYVVYFTFIQAWTTVQQIQNWWVGSFSWRSSSVCFYQNAQGVGFHYVVHVLCVCVTASLSGMNRRQRAAPAVSHKGLYGNCRTPSTPQHYKLGPDSSHIQSLTFHIPALLSQRCLCIYLSLSPTKSRGWGLGASHKCFMRERMYIV